MAWCASTLLRLFFNFSQGVERVFRAWTFGRFGPTFFIQNIMVEQYWRASEDVDEDNLSASVPLRFSITSSQTELLNLGKTRTKHETTRIALFDIGDLYVPLHFCMLEYMYNAQSQNAKLPGLRRRYALVEPFVCSVTKTRSTMAFSLQYYSVMVLGVTNIIDLIP